VRYTARHAEDPSGEGMGDENRETGVGIIGMGGRGTWCLGACFADTAHETGFRVRAICDRNPRRVSELPHLD